MGREYSMRDVERLTQTMAELQPDLYAVFTRSSISHLENEGQAWFNTTKNYKSLRAGLHLLFENDARWIELTAATPPYGLGDPGPLVRRVPLFREGDDVWREHLLSGENSHGQHQALTARTDYAVEVTRKRMLPFLTPGQVVQVQFATEIEPGEMAVLNRKDVLEIAWCVAPGRFALARGVGDFSIPATGAVLGVVVSIQPLLSVQNATQPDKTAQPS